MNIQIVIGVLLPFLGTSLGAAMVFFLKDSISDMLLLSGACFNRPWRGPRIWENCRFFRRQQGS